MELTVLNNLVQHARETHPIFDGLSKRNRQDSLRLGRVASARFSVRVVSWVNHVCSDWFKPSFSRGDWWLGLRLCVESATCDPTCISLRFADAILVMKVCMYTYMQRVHTCMMRVIVSRVCTVYACNRK